MIDEEAPYEMPSWMNDKKRAAALSQRPVIPYTHRPVIRYSNRQVIEKPFTFRSDRV